MNRKLKRKIKQTKAIFNCTDVEALARKTKFAQRNRKLTGAAFLNFCVFSNDSLCKESLVKLCTSLRKQEHVSISAEGLNQRFNDKAVGFIKTFLLSLLREHSKILDDNFVSIKDKFNRIRIMDSTSYSLPENLKDTYSGNGGGASIAAAKIHLEYDLLNGEFLNLDLSEGTKSDSSFMWDVMYSFEEGDLCIRDLGYYSSLALLKMKNKGVYFISKIKSSSTLFSTNKNHLCYRDTAFQFKEGEPFRIDIKKLHTNLKPGQTLELSDILFGKKHKVPLRVIVNKLPKKAEEKRKKQRENKAKKAKRKFSRDSLDGANIFVTNVPKELLDTGIIQPIYSLRWQIELIFKIWKSYFKIHEINDIKRERFECFVYGRLILLILGTLLINFSNGFENGGLMKEFSIIKCNDILRTYLSEIRETLYQNDTKFIKTIITILSDFSRYGCKSKRKSKLTAQEILLKI